MRAAKPRAIILGGHHPDGNRPRLKILVAITGASGSLYAQRLLDNLDSAKHEVHVVLSAYAHAVMSEELPRFPAASYAFACRVQEPLGQVAVFQENEAEEEALELTIVPLRYHSTLVTPTLSVAPTLTDTTPDTVLPAAGAVIVVVGAVVSVTVFWTVILT